MATQPEKIDPLFKLLIERTRILVAVCDNAAVVLSEEFQDMITQPMAAVNEVLKQCPDVGAWDGSFSEDDIIVETFRHESQPDGPPRSVRIRHVPTDMSVESYSKHTAAENELVARKALSDRVRYKWEREQEAQQQPPMGPRPARARRSR
jgi:protein subunit release factor A